MKEVQVTMYEDYEGFRYESKLDCLRADLRFALDQFAIRDSGDVIDNAEHIYNLLGSYILEHRITRSEKVEN